MREEGQWCGEHCTRSTCARNNFKGEMLNLSWDTSLFLRVFMHHVQATDVMQRPRADAMHAWWACSDPFLIYHPVVRNIISQQRSYISGYLFLINSSDAFSVGRDSHYRARERNCDRERGMDHERGMDRERGGGTRARG